MTVSLEYVSDYCRLFRFFFVTGEVGKFNKKGKNINALVQHIPSLLKRRVTSADFGCGEKEWLYTTLARMERWRDGGVLSTFGRGGGGSWSPYALTPAHGTDCTLLALK